MVIFVLKIWIIFHYHQFFQNAHHQMEPAAKDSYRKLMRQNCNCNCAEYNLAQTNNSTSSGQSSKISELPPKGNNLHKKEEADSVLLYSNCLYLQNTSKLLVIKTNLMHYLSSVYFVNQPLHVSGIFVAHHQEVYSIYTTIGTCCAF